MYETLRDIVLEFKYVGLKTLGFSAEEVRGIARDELAALPSVKAALDDAEAQLLAYKNTRTAQIQQPERLSALAVVALGFERVVWRVA